MLTPPVLLLLLSLQVAIGALIAASFQSWTLLFGPTILGAAIFACLQVSTPSSGARPWNWRKYLWSGLLLALVLILPVLGFAYASGRLPHSSNNDLSSLSGRSVELEAEVVSTLPAKPGKQARFVCAVSGSYAARGSQRLDCTGLTLLLVRKDSAVKEKLVRKSRFRCVCYVADLGTLESRGKGGYVNYLRRQGISSICYLKSDEQLTLNSRPVTESNSFCLQDFVCNQVEPVRARLIKSHVANLGSQTGTLLTAMVLGEKAVGLDPALLTSFRNVGLSHILAASGFNLTVVTFSIHWACRLFSVPVLPANFLCFSMMIVFVLFAGNSASVVRASLMCALALAANSLGRRIHVAGLLGAALLISILSDPLSVCDPGFQLSYAALSGIVFIVSPLSCFLKSAVEKPWIVWSLEVILTVLAAQACVLPLQLFYFKQVGLMFLPANLLASLMVTPITVAGFASSMILILCCQGFVLQPLLLCAAGCLDWLAALPLNLLVDAVRFLSSFTWAIVKVSPVEIWQVLLYYLILIAFSIQLIEQFKKWQKMLAAKKGESASSRSCKAGD